LNLQSVKYPTKCPTTGSSKRYTPNWHYVEADMPKAQMKA